MYIYYMYKICLINLNITHKTQGNNKATNAATLLDDLISETKQDIYLREFTKEKEAGDKTETSTVKRTSSNYVECKRIIYKLDKCI